MTTCPSLVIRNGIPAGVLVAFNFSRSIGTVMVHPLSTPVSELYVSSDARSEYILKDPRVKRRRSHLDDAACTLQS